MMETNHGSFAIVQKDYNLFRHASFSFYVCIICFKSDWKPLLFIDGTHSLGKYMAILLGVTGKDGNNCFFHVTFDIVDIEMNDN